MYKKSFHISEHATKMQPGVKPLPQVDPTVDPDHFPGEGYRVILYNDDFHSVDEVVAQLIKAIECSLDIAVDIMMRAHTRGSATVIIADQPVADEVAATLREIALIVSVERV